MTKTGPIVGLGEVLWDLFKEGEVLGGAPLNFAVHAHQVGRRFGLSATIASRVGDDARGKLARQRIEEIGLSTSHLQIDSAKRTGEVVVTSVNQENHYEITPDVAWDHLEFSNDWAQLAASASAVCFGTLGQRTTENQATHERFLAAASSAKRFLDMNRRVPFLDLETVQRSLKNATYLKLNDDESFWLAEQLGISRQGDVETIAARLFDHLRVERLFLTRGPRGCYLIDSHGQYDAEVERFEPAPHADTVGAGDAATAGFVVGTLLDWPPQKLTQVANWLGAYVASQHGATPELPDWLLTRIETFVSQ